MLPCSISPLRSVLVAHRLIHMSSTTLSNFQNSSFPSDSTNNNLKDNIHTKNKHSIQNLNINIKNTDSNSKNEVKNYNRYDKRNNNFNRSNRGNYTSRIKNAMPQFDSKISKDSPYYELLSEFNFSLNSILFNKNLRLPNFTRNHSRADDDIPLFWDSITKIIKLYDQLVGCPELNDQYISQYINMLHNALRINRTQFIKLNKKPDYDSKSFNNEMNILVMNSLRTIANDLTNGKIRINEFGMMHLLTSFIELSLPNESLQIWENCMKVESLQKINIKPKVVGVILPLLYQFEYSWETIEKIYMESKKKLKNVNSSLTLGMINTCLLARKNKLALELFNDMCTSTNEFKINFDYIKDAHLSIIGKCHDINVAESFWKNAINNEMPYKLDLQVSYVNSMLENIWQENKDMDKIINIWIQTLKHYQSLSLNLGIFSSLNNKFFKIFFEDKYYDDPVEGLNILKKILNQYHTIKKMDEPILNIVLTKCTVWKNLETANYIRSLFEIYNINESIITKRIELKNMNNFNELTADNIWEQWCDLMITINHMKQRYIANADWASLRDATLSHKDRITIYLQIVKLFRKYCRDYSQESKITNSWSKLYPLLKERINEVDAITTEPLKVPQLDSLKIYNAENSDV